MSSRRSEVLRRFCGRWGRGGARGERGERCGVRGRTERWARGEKKAPRRRKSTKAPGIGFLAASVSRAANLRAVIHPETGVEDARRALAGRSLARSAPSDSCSETCRPRRRPSARCTRGCWSGARPSSWRRPSLEEPREGAATGARKDAMPDCTRERARRGRRRWSWRESWFREEGRRRSSGVDARGSAVMTSRALGSAFRRPAWFDTRGCFVTTAPRCVVRGAIAHLLGAPPRDDAFGTRLRAPGQLPPRARAFPPLGARDGADSPRTRATRTRASAVVRARHRSRCTRARATGHVVPVQHGAPRQGRRRVRGAG